MSSKSSTSSNKSNPISRIFAVYGLNIALLVIGFCLLFWADKVTAAVSIVLGLILLFSAGYYVIDFIADKQREDNDGEISKIISAIFLAILGLFFIAQQDFISSFISVIVGIGLAISGLNGIHRSLELKLTNPEDYLKPLVGAIICTVCGALCIIGKLMVPEIMLQLMGVMLIAYAIVSSYGITSLFNIVKKNEQSKEELAIEAEVVTDKNLQTKEKELAKAEKAAAKARRKAEKTATKKLKKAQKKAAQSTKPAANDAKDKHNDSQN